MRGALVAQALAIEPLDEVGIVVGEEGLEPSESKTTALQAAPLPVTVYSPI